MKLADILGGKVNIHPEMLLIPAFKHIYEKDPEHAITVISYIVFRWKYDSPYVGSMPPDEIESKLKKEFFGDSDYELTPEEQHCEHEYKLFTETQSIKMLNNMRLKLDSISKYYKESLEDTLDEKKIKDLLAGMTSVGNVFKSIDALEKSIRLEESVNTKVRGNAKLNSYEIPR